MISSFKLENKYFLAVFLVQRYNTFCHFFSDKLVRLSASNIHVYSNTRVGKAGACTGGADNAPEFEGNIDLVCIFFLPMKNALA
jgi:hypothetical protein